MNLQHIINHPDITPASGLYSQGVKVVGNGLVFVSGQTALDNTGNLVGEDDVAAQTRQVFENIGKVLSISGSDFRMVVEFTIYLVGEDSVADFIQTRKEIFKTIYPDEKYPCSTLVNVMSLGGSKALVEISATAALKLPE